MPLPLAVPLIVGGAMAAGGVAGSLFGKKKAKTPDISQQLAEAQILSAKNKQLNRGLGEDLQPLTADYAAGADKARAGLQEAFGTGKKEYLDTTNELTNKAQGALRENLYSNTFSALPDTLRAVREASAAGSGIDSGAYQQAVQNVGVDTARTVAGGERDIQLAGMENMQKAQENIFGAFNQLSSKLSDMDMAKLTKVMDTGREDTIRQATVEMGLNEAETQSIIDLLNFRQSGELAVNTAADANRQSLYNSLIGGGASIAGSAAGKLAPATQAKGA